MTSGLAQSRPSPSGSGDVYLCTDTGMLCFDSPVSSAWQSYAAEAFPGPPLASAYTLAPASELGLGQYGDTIRATVTSQTGVAYCALTTSRIGSGGYPASLGASVAWMVTLAATWTYNPVATNTEIGLCISNGTTTGTSVAYGAFWDSNGSGAPFIVAGEFTVGSTRIGSPLYDANVLNALYGTGRVHFRLLNDTAVLHFQYSADGFNWLDFYNMTTPTPSGGFTDYGFWLGSDQGSSVYAQANVNANQLGIPTQYNVTGATNASPSVITIGTHAIQPGDTVAIIGSVGNTGINTSAGGAGAVNSGAVLVTAVTSTTITTTQNGNGAWTSGGVVTLLSR